MEELFWCWNGCALGLDVRMPWRSYGWRDITQLAHLKHDVACSNVESSHGLESNRVLPCSYALHNIVLAHPSKPVTGQGVETVSCDL